MKQFTLLTIFLNLSLCTFTLVQTQELERLISFQSCRYDADCHENSFCYGNDDVNSGKCRCKENYILTDRNRTYYECVPAAGGIDGPCSKDIQCQVTLGVYASCKNDFCKCREDAHLGNDNKCHRTAALGEICETDNNCRLGDGTNAFCVVGRCSCNLNYRPSEDLQRCIFSVDLGKSCPTSESCVHPFAECFDGICRCLAGYIESDDNSKCLQAASSFGENCTESIQCSAYLQDSFCYNGTCSCKSAHHGYGTECILDAKLGDRCSADRECIITPELQHSVRCTDGICTCVEGVSDQNSYGCIIRDNGGATAKFFKFLIVFVLGVIVRPFGL